MKGKSVTIYNAYEDEGAYYPEACRKEGIASILSVPVVHEGEIIGVIRVFSKEPRHFTEEDVDFLNASSHLGAIALENVKRYEYLQEEYTAFRQSTF